MKTKVINVAKAILFVTIFFIGLSSLYGFFKWKDTNGDYFSTFDSLYSLDKNSVDVVFVGPSYTYQSINPAYFWDNYGLSVFTMSISGQDKRSALASIKEVLKTQQPEIVLVDASATFFDMHAVQSNIYRNTVTMKLSKNNVENILKSVEPDERLDYIIRWPIVHTRYKELTRYDFEQYMPSIYSMGFRYLFGSMPRTPFSIDDAALASASELSDTNKEWIDEWIEISNENNFNLVFYYTPGTLSGDRVAAVNGVTEYLNSLNVALVNLNETSLFEEIDYSTDFGDYHHLNYWGSVKVDEFFAEYLFNNYVLNDHRNEPGYDAWDNSVRYEKHMLGNYQAGNDEDFVAVSESIGKLDSLAVVLALEGDYLSSELDILKVVQNFGLTEQDYLTGGTWIIEDGVVTHYISGVENCHIKANNAEYINVSRIIGNLGLPVTNVVMNNSYYRNEAFHINGLYLFAYDKLLNETVLNKYYQ